MDWLSALVDAQQQLTEAQQQLDAELLQALEQSLQTPQHEQTPHPHSQ